MAGKAIHMTSNSCIIIKNNNINNTNNSNDYSNNNFYILEDNVFSTNACLPYGPLMNTYIDYYQTFYWLVAL